MDSNSEEKLQALMVKSQMGDPVAYGELLDELYKLLKGYVASMAKTDADDILQDIILTVHKVRPTYDPSRPFLPWLFSIAKHRVQDSKRLTWRHLRKGDALREEMASQTSYTQGGTSALKDAVSELPDRQREVVTMLKIQGFSVKEIAERLRTSPGSVKVTAHRAYEALRRKLTEVPDEV